MKAKGGKILMMVVLACVSLASHFLRAQEPVTLCQDWLATVDESSQNIVLRWRPSPDSNVMGYHICTGMPCVDYDTVFGRLDTTYICLDHSPLEQHTYRLHVFDSAYNVSQLTPSFGNIVLTAEVPECQPIVNVSWTHYEGMPGGMGLYKLMAMLEPFDTVFTQVGVFSANDSLQYFIDIPDNTTRVHVKVLAYNQQSTLESQSNTVSVERRVARTACCNSISAISYDSVRRQIGLQLYVDTNFTYTLWRSIDGSPWQVIDSIHPSQTECEYYDTDINRFDLLYCYQLSVADDCGLNEQFSRTVWINVPAPPQPSIYIPNVIVVGSENNDAFRPVTSGIMGDLYQLNIYNRSGLLVFSTEDPAAEWHPADNVQQGAYSYHLRIRFNDNKIHTYIGTIIIIR